MRSQSISHITAQVLAMLACLVLLNCAWGYDNPIKCDLADPGPMEFRGEYYIYYSTGQNIELWKSRDLVNWTNQGVVFTNPTGHSMWAAETWVIDGTIYLYYSDIIESMYSGMVAKASDPAGPFYTTSLSVKDSIDGSVFVANSGDIYYLASGMPNFGTDWLAEIWMWKMTSPCSLTNSADYIVASTPTKSWEGIINEGPMAIEHKGQCYVFYSAEAAYLPNYVVTYLKTPMSNLSSWTSDRWFKSSPILAKRSAGPQSVTLPHGADPGVWGPGHGGWVRGLNGIDYWYVYHRKRYNNDGFVRDMAIDRMFWMRPNYVSGNDIGDTVMIDGPTDCTDAEEAADPTPATFTDLFDVGDNEGKPAPGWTYISGSWELDPTSAITQTTTTEGPQVAVAGPESQDLVVECWARMGAFPTDAKAGICIYQGPGTTIYFGLGRTGHTPYAYYKVVDETLGDWTSMSTASGPLTPILSRYHKLRIEKVGNYYTFYLDKKPVGNVSGFSGPARGGLFTESCQAYFDGFKSTVGFIDTFEEPTLTCWQDSDNGRKASGNWHLEELRAAGSYGQPEWKVLRQDTLGDDECKWPAVFRPGLASDYEFSAGISQLEAGTTAEFPKCGIYSCYKDEQNFSTVFLDVKSNVLATYGMVNGREQPWKNSALPSGYNSTEFNTLRVLKRGIIQKFYVNGDLLQVREFDIDMGQVGLVVEDARADYDDVTYIRIDSPKCR